MDMEIPESLSSSMDLLKSTYEALDFKVEETSKGPSIKLSRKHYGFVKRLFVSPLTYLFPSSVTCCNVFTSILYFVKRLANLILLPFLPMASDNWSSDTIANASFFMKQESKTEKVLI